MSYLLSITPYILEGFKTTFLVFAVTLLVSLPLAIILATTSLHAPRPVKRLLSLYTWVMRGTPLILQLYVIVFGLPLLIPGFFTRQAIIGACLTFILNYTAYFIEIFKGGLITIDPGQWEAASTLHISRFNTYSRIIMPQMIRNSLYALSNECISLVKDTSLVTVVGIGEIFRNAKEIMNRDLKIQALFIVAIVYLLFTFIVIQVFKAIEARLRMERKSL